MSENMNPRLCQTLDRAIEQVRRKLYDAMEATGQSTSLGTNNNSVIFRVTTSSDAAVRGLTLTMNLVESGSPGGLSPTAGFDVTGVV